MSASFEWPSKFPGYNPIRLDYDGIPVFSINQIDDYGPPDEFGVFIYRAIETRDDQVYVMDYKMEVEFRRAARPIHRYSRLERFKSVLFNLLGYRGSFDDEVMELFSCLSRDPEMVWTECRKILYVNNLKRLYNQIPSILRKLGWEIWQCSYNTLQNIVKEFIQISFKFDNNRPKERKYFLNLRYVALKLLEKHGIVFGYHVPLLQTKFKLEQMNKLWVELLE